jgi:hypothetical protein
MRNLLIVGSFLLLSTAAAVSCSSPDPSARIDPIGPDRTTFEPVAKMLGRRCGTLDCHGSTYRNLRLYGYGGLRLDVNLLPESDAGANNITTAEVDADYEAVIGLEPEVMRLVVLDKGFAPERLTLVRKGRGTEDHKGEGPIKVGDDADRCLVSWLASATDTAACSRAAVQP